MNSNLTPENVAKPPCRVCGLPVAAYAADEHRRDIHSSDEICILELKYALSQAQQFKAGARRYEIVRRLNVPAFKALIVASMKTPKPFDELVDELAPFVGISSIQQRQEQPK